MASKDFLLPDLGEGLTEGEMVRWLVSVGDTVDVDQPVAEVETAKAVVEVPSPFSGTVKALHAEIGDEVEVGKPLVTVEVADDHAEAEPADDRAEAEPADDQAAPTADGNGSGAVLVGYGAGGGATSRRRRADRRGGGTQAPGDGRPLAKPPVRKMAKDLGVDLAEVPGSGPHGTITRDDIRAYASQQAEAAAGIADVAPSLAFPLPGEGGDREERIPLRGVRKRIAEKVAVSRREIPDATTWVDCDATGLMSLRDELNAAEDHPVTPLAIIMRACVAGLRRFPTLNARLDTETGEIVLQRSVHLGFAAQTDRGLVVPVIKEADRRPTLDIARELHRLAVGAREGTIGPEELTGGTFTVSNYGSFGVDGGSAIINHPQVAILGTGRISDRPWVVDGSLAVRKVMQLSITFDHRVADGGEAAGFLRFVADCVESPARLVGAL